jgi:hypothetical protein
MLLAIPILEIGLRFGAFGGFHGDARDGLAAVLAGFVRVAVAFEGLDFGVGAGVEVDEVGDVGAVVGGAVLCLFDELFEGAAGEEGGGVFFHRVEGEVGAFAGWVGVFVAEGEVADFRLVVQDVGKVFVVVELVELFVGCFARVGDAGGDEEEAWFGHFG